MLKRQIKRGVDKSKKWEVQVAPKEKNGRQVV